MSTKRGGLPWKDSRHLKTTYSFKEMITIKDISYSVVRREGQPALVNSGTHIILFDAHDPKRVAHLPIAELPF